MVSSLKTFTAPVVKPVNFDMNCFCYSNELCIKTALRVTGCALKEALTIVRCQKRCFVYVVFYVDGLPVKHRRGYYLTICSVD